MKPTSFILGEKPETSLPLSRYLPPLPVNIAAKWLKQIGLPENKNTWIIDPFGSFPRMVVETAQAGYRIFVTANNPITRFLIEMSANPPSRNDFQAGMAALASSSRGTERLEAHIRGIYRIRCLECSSEVEVEAYLWEKNAAIPYGCIYSCAECGFEGEKHLPLEFAEKTTTFTATGLHYARALERVTSREDPDRIFVEEALSVYPSRSIYVLFILINKLNSLHLTTDQLRAIQILLLSACDMANAMWDYPSRRERPRQLSIPSKYRENNIWKIMEKSIDLWIKPTSSPVSVSIYPDLPTGNGGVCIYEGPLRDLMALKTSPEMKIPTFKAILAAIPRPNQAFWSLSALWSGWLWGREAVGPFKGVLRRKRYDWSWLNTALQASFTNLFQLTDAGTPVLGLTGEAEAGLLTATIRASDKCGFKLTGFSLRDEQAQFHWMREESITKEYSNKEAGPASEAINSFLLNYRQPAPYLKVWSAGLIGLATNARTQIQEKETDPQIKESGISETNSLLRDILTYRGGFLRFGTGESLENSLWWLKQELRDEDSINKVSITDEVEIAVVNELVKNPSIDRDAVDHTLIQKFQGILTPDSEWIQVILESYAVEHPPKSNQWTLRKEDQPNSRRFDLEKMQSQLESLASKIGYSQENTSPLIWSLNGIPQFYFYLTASAVISNIILKNEISRFSPPHKSIIVLPGGRANLIIYKLRLDPRLNRLCSTNEQNLQTGWRFLKTRHLRWLLDNSSQIQSFENQLALDPLTFSAPQTRFL